MAGGRKNGVPLTHPVDLQGPAGSLMRRIQQAHQGLHPPAPPSGAMRDTLQGGGEVPVEGIKEINTSKEGSQSQNTWSQGLPQARWLSTTRDRWCLWWGSARTWQRDGQPHQSLRRLRMSQQWLMPLPALLILGVTLAAQRWVLLPPEGPGPCLGGSVGPGLLEEAPLPTLRETHSGLPTLRETHSGLSLRRLNLSQRRLNMSLRMLMASLGRLSSRILPSRRRRRKKMMMMMSQSLKMPSTKKRKKGKEKAEGMERVRILRKTLAMEGLTKGLVVGQPQNQWLWKQQPEPVEGYLRLLRGWAWWEAVCCTVYRAADMRQLWCFWKRSSCADLGCWEGLGKKTKIKSRKMVRKKRGKKGF